ncbi:MAG: DUF5071 domain-containing protein [Chitinophaga sp.]|uniref:DUF5071 domain-containing protein n=1 Tax=Chitinophaga sp. TaxID=1869181 RepID=UPI001B11B8CE|nr:DUF5071 domain-containing protein [Chitinophaga sp.]MBO9732802.1 DUF5071 domain-containing protein [Chitinophaga sp.]
MKDYIPKTKDDLSAVEILKHKSFEDVKAEVSYLLGCLQDLHWDVASEVGAYLAPHVNEIKDNLLDILLSNDEEWKFGIMKSLIAIAPVKLDEELLFSLERIRDCPTEREVNEELHLVAREILEKEIN